MNNRPTKAQLKRHGKIRDLGCMVCNRPADIHHCLITAGCRKNHDFVIPLCPDHHRTGGYGTAIHSGKYEWESRNGTEAALLEKVSRLVDV